MSLFFYRSPKDTFSKIAVFFSFKTYPMGPEQALACRLPRGMYDALERHGGPVGRRVAEAQRASMENLWRQVNLPAGHADRHTRLAARLRRHYRERRTILRLVWWSGWETWVYEALSSVKYRSVCWK